MFKKTVLTIDHLSIVLFYWIKDYPGDNFVSSCWALNNTVDVKDFVNSIEVRH